MVHVGIDLGPAGLAVRQNAVKTVRKQIGTVNPEDGDRRKLNAFGKRLGVLGDDVVVDLLSLGRAPC